MTCDRRPIGEMGLKKPLAGFPARAYEFLL